MYFLVHFSSTSFGKAETSLLLKPLPSVADLKVIVVQRLNFKLVISYADAGCRESNQLLRHPPCRLYFLFPKQRTLQIENVFYHRHFQRRSVYKEL